MYRISGGKLTPFVISLKIDKTERLVLRNRHIDTWIAMLLKIPDYFKLDYVN